MQTLGGDIIINKEEDQGLVKFEEQEDANYVSEEDSFNDETNSEEDEMDDKVVMSNDDDEIEVEQSLIEEVDVDTYGMDEHTEIVEEKVEEKLNATGRPKHQCACAGVERLEMSLDNSKEYTYVKEKNIHLP